LEKSETIKAWHHRGFSSSSFSDFGQEFRFQRYRYNWRGLHQEVRREGRGRNVLIIGSFEVTVLAVFGSFCFCGFGGVVGFFGWVFLGLFVLFLVFFFLCWSLVGW